MVDMKHKTTAELTVTLLQCKDEILDTQKFNTVTLKDSFPWVRHWKT